MRDKIFAKIREFNDIIIIPHIRPDGDCFGSAFGLKYIIESIYPNKHVYVIGETTKSTSFMGETSNVSDDLFQTSLVISVDTGSLGRVFDDRVLTGKYVIRIDHHPHVEHFGDLEYIDSNYPSTCTIITDMFREKGIEIPKQAAECLFFGTSTDTGRFRYRGVTSNTHLNVAYLLETGIDTDKLFNYIYLKDYSAFKLEAEIVSMINSTDNGLLYLKLTAEKMEKLNIKSEEAGNAISKLEYIRDYPVWAVFYSHGDIIRGRLRSRGPVVNEIAAKYRGGGHAYASGVTLDSWDELDNLIKDLDIAIVNYKKNMTN
ncbi:bifunctional oligoribonuclease/PAP phosphatase NrnA [Mycoplasmatota bacterium zrk1]